MKITKTILILLLSTVMFAAYADKPKKQDPLLTGPFFIQPYFNAFGMRVQEVDTTEARRGCVDVWEHQSARAYYFVSKKNAETSMEYTTGESDFRIDNIKFHVYREYPTVEETVGFMWNEIPKDWQEISEEEYIEHTKEKCRRMVKYMFRDLSLRCEMLSLAQDRRPSNHLCRCMRFCLPSKKESGGKCQYLLLGRWWRSEQIKHGKTSSLLNLCILSRKHCKKTLEASPNTVLVKLLNN